MADNKLLEINGRLYDEYGRLVQDQNGAISGTISSSSKNKSKAHKIASYKKRPIQKSTTLLRKAVKKSNMSDFVNPVSGISSSLSPASTSVASARITRTRSVNQNNLIKDFGDKKALPNFNGEIHPIAKKPVYKPSLDTTKKAYNPFDDAVARAVPPNHSNQKTHKPNSLFSYNKIMIFLFLIISFIVLYFTLPNTTASYVAYKSGVNISVPYSIPNGYILSTKIPYSNGTLKLVYGKGNQVFYLIEKNNATSQTIPFADISKLYNIKYPIYGWTKKNVDFILITNGDLSQRDIANIYLST